MAHKLNFHFSAVIGFEFNSRCQHFIVNMLCLVSYFVNIIKSAFLYLSLTPAFDSLPFVEMESLVVPVSLPSGCRTLSGPKLEGTAETVFDVSISVKILNQE